MYTDASKSTLGISFSTIENNINLLYKLLSETSILFLVETQVIFEAIIIAKLTISNHTLS